jgi:hypothetical protein
VSGVVAACTRLRLRSAHGVYGVLWILSNDAQQEW